MNPNILTIAIGLPAFFLLRYASAQRNLQGWEIIAATSRNYRRQPKIKGDNHDAR